jgi:hypothetical protein
VGKTALTYRDYAALPDDGRRYEVHAGELSVTPAPGSPAVLWLIDPDARTIEVFVLDRDRSALAATATGPEPIAVPPFSGLRLVPDTLWP